MIEGTCYLCVVHASGAVHGIVVSIQQLLHNLLIGQVATASRTRNNRVSTGTVWRMAW